MAIRHLHDLSVVGNVTVATTGVTNNVLLTSTDTSSASAPDLVLYRNALIADSDTLGVLEFQGRNGMVTSSTAPLTYGAIYGRVFDASENHTGLTISANKGNGSGAYEGVANITLIGSNNAGEGAIIINPDTDFELPNSNLEVKGSYGITTQSHGSSANWKQAYDNYITGIGVSGTSTKTITLTQRDGGTITTTFTDLEGSGGGIDMTNGSNNRVVTAVDSDSINAESGLLFGGSYLEITPGNVATPLQVKRTSASTRQVNLMFSANDGTTTSEGFLGIDNGADLRYGAGANTAGNSLVLTEDNTDFVVNSSTNSAIIRLAGGGTNFTSFTIGGLAGAITVNTGTNSLTIGHHDTSSASSSDNSGGTVIQDITLDTYGHVTAIGTTNLDSRYFTETEADGRYVNVGGDTMTGDLVAPGLYVGSANTSYDFYNNGTSYLNGATIVDANLKVTTLAGANTLYLEGGSANWHESTPGSDIGTIHLDPNTTTDNFGSAITFGASDASSGTNAQAGIYTRSDGNYGTKMYFATTDSYAVGSKVRMTIRHDGQVHIAQGKLVLDGTGRIQGIDTVSANTDAANKQYVDNHTYSHNHDDRYYTETESDAKYLLNTTDTLTGNLTVTGNVTHSGLTMTSGTDVDQIYSATKTLTLSTSWQDTGIIFSNLTTGSYILQVYVNDHSVGGNHYSEYYTGVMSWYSSGTNSTVTDEINLHRAGHAPNSGDIFLRTARTSGNTSPNLHMEIRGSTSNSGTSGYTFKFRRLI